MSASAKMTNRTERIVATLSANEAKIKSFGVRSLSLFGSSAHGENTPESDLDFVVEFEKKSFDSYMDLKLFLEELFDRPVDLVLADGIKPRLRAAILQEAIHAPGTLKSISKISAKPSSRSGPTPQA